LENLTTNHTNSFLRNEHEHENIPFLSRRNMETLHYGILLKNKYTAYIVRHDKIIMELKAITKIANQHKGPINELFGGYMVKVKVAGKFYFLSQS